MIPIRLRILHLTKCTRRNHEALDNASELRFVVFGESFRAFTRSISRTLRRATEVAP